MFPKAYIFTINPQPQILANLKTKYSANVSITAFSTYLKHHPDVEKMVKIAHYQHPRPAFTDVITIPNVDKTALFGEYMKKNSEAFYIVDSESDLDALDVLATSIESFGPDLRRITDNAPNMFAELFHMEGSGDDLHDQQHELIQEHFVNPLAPR
jgi:hypothetical protein